MIEVDEKKMPWSKGMTITSLFQTLNDVEYCSVVRLNGKLISRPQFTDTPVPDNSIIQLLPLVAGG
ncbi:MAG: MoaD/ThiS family protein [Desulfobacula sp.]|nr:MoaD/ThiS family protein [Desulfobacula sp.]